MKNRKRSAVEVVEIGHLRAGRCKRIWRCLLGLHFVIVDLFDDVPEKVNIIIG